ncbi:MAG TPA: DUF1993 domain-containing protein [Rhizomicrobium sp.]|nr:DUF1993 domain-containing protein [Rhizomicrobium sp.]
MAVSLYAISVGIYVPMLETLTAILDKGAEHAKANGKNPDALLDAKLAGDMFPLSLQVRLCCHHAKDGVARLTGATPPTIQNMGGDVKTLAEMKAYVLVTITQLRALTPQAFEGAESRKIAFAMQGPVHWESDGVGFLRDWSLGHFYFHMVTAYDILRNQGVELGKRDYMAHVGGHIHPGAMD